VSQHSGQIACDYIQVDGGNGRSVAGGVIAETKVCLSINGREWLSVLCSPLEPGDLALGFLLNEGIIDDVAAVHSLHVAEDGSCVDIWLKHAVTLPERLTITSGCGGGVTFDETVATRAPLTSTRTIDAAQVQAMMRALNGAAELYRDVRGVHTSALCDGERLLHVAQDIGRHNTIDRLRGIAARCALDTRDLILIASGRISAEMLAKAAAMGVPIVCSRTSPTSASVALARAWNMTVIGYARGRQFRIYSGAERVKHVMSS
jgi:FdhD protein